MLCLLLHLQRHRSTVETVLEYVRLYESLRVCRHSPPTEIHTDIVIEYRYSRYRGLEVVGFHFGSPERHYPYVATEFVPFV